MHSAIGTIILKPKQKEFFSWLWTIDCQFCGKVFIYKLGLCFQCYSKVINDSQIWTDSNQPILKLKEENLEIYSLIHWIPEYKINLGPWIVYLKTYQSMHAWKRLAKYIIHSDYFEKLIKENRNAEIAMFLLPSSTNRMHAHMFGYYLNSLTGFTVYNVLKINTENELISYKNLNKLNRLDRKISVSVDFTNDQLKRLQLLKTVILIDDIVTTGSTMKMAKIALNEFIPAAAKWVGATVFYRNL